MLQVTACNPAPPGFPCGVFGCRAIPVTLLTTCKMKNKRVIQRNLPLTIKYSLTEVTYLSIEDGGGCQCDNCGKLITNIAHIQGDNKSYSIGLDCLDTLLKNNKLLDNESHIQYLFSDKPAIQKAKSLRSKLLKKAKDEPTYRAIFREFADSFGFSFEVDTVRTYQYDSETKSLKTVAPYVIKDPQGFDYTFNPKYKDLTLNYIKGLTNVVF